MFLQLDGNGPLYSQLTRALKQAILRGQLKAVTTLDGGDRYSSRAISSVACPCGYFSSTAHADCSVRGTMGASSDSGTRQV